MIHVPTFAMFSQSVPELDETGECSLEMLLENRFIKAVLRFMEDVFQKERGLPEGGDRLLKTRHDKWSGAVIESLAATSKCPGNRGNFTLSNDSVHTLLRVSHTVVHAHAASMYLRNAHMCVTHLVRMTTCRLTPWDDVCNTVVTYIHIYTHCTYRWDLQVTTCHPAKQKAKTHVGTAYHATVSRHLQILVSMPIPHCPGEVSTD